MSKEIIHSFILVITISLAFLLPKTIFATYDLQITAVLFIILFASKKILIPQKPLSRLLESVIFTLVVLLTINTTGGIQSPFYFLLYFLLFALSLLLEPVISITITSTLIIFFLLNLPEGATTSSFVAIFSLAFLTPFALFMSQEHIEIQKLKVKSQKKEEDTLLFLSLMIKNHLKIMKNALENFMGDHELEIIKKSVHRIEKLIEKFEKTN